MQHYNEETRMEITTTTGKDERTALNNFRIYKSVDEST
jgi:hypothetical protein